MHLRVVYFLRQVAVAVGHPAANHPEAGLKLDLNRGPQFVRERSLLFFAGVGISIVGWPNNLREEPSQASNPSPFAAPADI